MGVEIYPGDLQTTCKIKNTDAQVIYISTNAMYQVQHKLTLSQIKN